MPIGYRIFWGEKNGSVLCTLTSTLITRTSLVLVNASEGAEIYSQNDGSFLFSSKTPDRFIGDANFSVLNIAPFDGGVKFRVLVNWSDPLPLWTDILVYSQTEMRFREIRLIAPDKFEVIKING